MKSGIKALVLLALSYFLLEELFAYWERTDLFRLVLFVPYLIALTSCASILNLLLSLVLGRNAAKLSKKHIHKVKIFKRNILFGTVVFENAVVVLKEKRRGAYVYQLKWGKQIPRQMWLIEGVFGGKRRIETFRSIFMLLLIALLSLLYLFLATLIP